MKVGLPIRKPVWKLLILLFSVVGVLLGSFQMWIKSAEQRKWAAVDKSVRKLVAEALERRGSRIVLHGETIPGNAWDDYESAISEYFKIRSAVRTVLGTFPWEPESVDLNRVRKALELCTPVIESVRQGAHRADSRRNCVAEDGLWAETPSSKFYQLYEIQQVLRLQSHLFRRDGRKGDALRTLLDVCQMRQELGYQYSHRDVMQDLGSLLMQETLTPADLQILETAMERAEHPAIDGQWDGVEALADDGSILLRGELPAVRDWTVSKPSWRYGFSTRIQRADAFFALEDLARARATLTGEELKVFEFNWGRQHGKNRQSGALYASYRPGWRQGPLDLAMMRLLRAAARFRRTGEMIQLEDPCGGWLRHKRNDFEDRFWSKGNGTDDGGIGSFRQWAPWSPDIVLVIPR